jgi:hypothetical protein
VEAGGAGQTESASVVVGIVQYADVNHKRRGPRKGREQIPPSSESGTTTAEKDGKTRWLVSTGNIPDVDLNLRSNGDGRRPQWASFVEGVVVSSESGFL